MKKLFIMVLMVLLFVSCKKSDIKVTELETSDEKYIEILSFFDSLDNKEQICGLLKGKDCYGIVYFNPNMKVDKVSANIEGKNIHISLSTHSKKNQPIRIFKIKTNVGMMELIENSLENHEIFLEENGVNTKLLIIDGVSALN